MKNAAMIIAVLALVCACTATPPATHHYAPVLDAKSLDGVDDIFAVPAEAFRTAVERGAIPEGKRLAIASALTEADSLLSAVHAAYAANDAAVFYAKISQLSSASFRINEMIADAELSSQPPSVASGEK